MLTTDNIVLSMGMRPKYLDVCIQNHICCNNNNIIITMYCSIMSKSNLIYSFLNDQFPGAKEYCISSDDIFSLKKPPGKT